MNVVFPVVHSPECRGFLNPSAEGGSSLGLRLALALAAEGRCRVLVHAEDEGLAQGFVGHGLDVTLNTLPTQALTDAPALPPGGLRAIRDLRAVGKLTDEDLVAVVDWRNALLRPESVLAALETARASGGEVFASLSQVRDHPVQQDVPLSILWFDLLVFQDRSPRGLALQRERGRALTRPFPVDWHARCLHDDPSQVYLAQAWPDAAEFRYRPAALVPQPHAPHGLFVMEQGLFGRRMLTPDEQAIPGKAVSAYVTGAGMPVSAWADDDRLRLKIHQPDLPAGTFLRAWGLRDGQVRLLGQSGPGVSTRTGEALALPLTGDVPGDMSGARPERGLDGVFVALLHCVRGEHHLLEAVKGGEKFWNVDPLTHRRVCSRSGTALFNRQDFPSLMAPDGALAAGSVAALLSLEADTELMPLSLEARERLKLTAPLEYLRIARSLGLRPDPRLLACLDAAGEERNHTALDQQFFVPCESARCLEALDTLGARLDHDPASPDLPKLHDVLDRMLETAMWKHFALHRFLTAPAMRGRDLASLELIVSSLAGRLGAMRAAVWVAAGRIMRPRLAATPLLSTRPAAGDMPPLPCRVLSSNGLDTVYLAAYDMNLKAALYGKGLDGGLRLINTDSAYSGLWHDPDSGLLHAARYAREGRLLPGLDVFDPKGRLVASHDFKAGADGNRLLPCCLHGDSKRLYCYEINSRLILALDKETFRPIDAHCEYNVASLGDYRALEDGLLVCHRTNHILFRLAWDGSMQAMRADRETLFSHVLDVWRPSSHIYLVTTQRDFTDQQDRPLHWLKRFDEELRLLETRSLGERRIMNVHIMEGAGVMALLDLHRGLEFLDLA